MKTSEKRLAANRANAAKSTGPRTSDGKARSCQNSRKHGFTSSKYEVVRAEELDSIARLRADAIAVYQPVNSQELFAVERIAIAQQALLRCAAMEAGLHTLAMNESMRDEETFSRIHVNVANEMEVSRMQNRSLCLAFGFDQLNQRGNSWRLFLRYQSQTERLYRRAIEDFERLKALRHELPNEPIAEPEVLATSPSDILDIPKPDPDLWVSSFNLEKPKYPPQPANQSPELSPGAPPQSDAPSLNDSNQR